MAYILTLLCREIGCPRHPTKRVMTQGGIRIGDYCAKHAGAEFARVAEREKAAGKGVRPQE